MLPTPCYPDPTTRPGFCPACWLPLDFTPMGSGFAHCVRCGWSGVLACPDCGAAFSEAGPAFYWCSREHGTDPARPGAGTFRASAIAARCASGA